MAKQIQRLRRSPDCPVSSSAVKTHAVIAFVWSAICCSMLRQNMPISAACSARTNHHAAVEQCRHSHLRQCFASQLVQLGAVLGPLDGYVGPRLRQLHVEGVAQYTRRLADVRLRAAQDGAAAQQFTSVTCRVCATIVIACIPSQHTLPNPQRNLNAAGTGTSETHVQSRSASLLALDVMRFDLQD